jgi:hypothetical protein
MGNCDAIRTVLSAVLGWMSDAVSPAVSYRPTAFDATARAGAGSADGARPAPGDPPPSAGRVSEVSEKK